MIIFFIKLQFQIFYKYFVSIIKKIYINWILIFANKLKMDFRNLIVDSDSLE